MAEELDKKLREYIKKTLKQGYSKEQIRISLKRVGYDIGIINKSFTDISRKRTVTNVLLALLIVLVVGLFLFWNYYLKPKEPLVFIMQEPKERFTQSNKPMLLMSWALPLEAKQNELINLTTIWKSQKEVTKNYGTMFFLTDKNGHALTKYFFDNNHYPTSLRRENYTYLETYRLNVPFLEPNTYYYRIGLWDSSNKRFFYSYDGAILGNITIKENLDTYPCGLVISRVRDGSYASNLGTTRGEKIISVNEEPIELRDDIYETVNLLRNKFSKEKTLIIKTNKSLYTIQNYNITSNLYRSLGILLDFELCQK